MARIALFVLWVTTLTGCQPYPDSEVLMENPAAGFSDLGQRRMLRLLQVSGDRSRLRLEYNQPLRFPGDPESPPEGFAVEGIPAASMELSGVATVEAVFQRPLPRARSYRATVGPGWRALAGASALEPVAVEWETERPRLLEWRTRPGEAEEREPDEVPELAGEPSSLLSWEPGSVLDLWFDQPIDPESLEASLSLQELETLNSVPLVVLEEQRVGQGATVSVRTGRALTSPALLRLESGLLGREGPLPSLGQWEAILTPKLELEVDFEPSTGELTFDGPVALEELVRCSRPAGSQGPLVWEGVPQSQASPGSYRTFRLGGPTSHRPALLVPGLTGVWGQRLETPHLLWRDEDRLTEESSVATAPFAVQAQLVPEVDLSGRARQLFGFVTTDTAPGELLFEALDEQGQVRSSHRVRPDTEGRFWTRCPVPQAPGLYWMQVRSLGSSAGELPDQNASDLGPFRVLPAPPDLLREGVRLVPLEEGAPWLQYLGRDPFGVTAEARLFLPTTAPLPNSGEEPGLPVWPSTPRWLPVELSKEPSSQIGPRGLPTLGWRIEHSGDADPTGPKEPPLGDLEVTLSRRPGATGGAEQAKPSTVTAQQMFPYSPESIPESSGASDLNRSGFTLKLQSAAESPHPSSEMGVLTVAVEVAGWEQSRRTTPGERVEGRLYRLVPEPGLGPTEVGQLEEPDEHDHALLGSPGWRKVPERVFQARLTPDGRAVGTWHFELEPEARYLLQAVAYDGDRQVLEAAWLWGPSIGTEAQVLAVPRDTAAAVSAKEALSPGRGQLELLDSDGEAVEQALPGDLLEAKIASEEGRVWEGFFWWEALHGAGPSASGPEYLLLSPGERATLEVPSYPGGARLRTLIRPWGPGTSPLVWSQELPPARPFEFKIVAPNFIRSGDEFQAGLEAFRESGLPGSVGLGFEAVEWSGLEQTGYRQTSHLLKPGHTSRADFSYRTLGLEAQPAEAELAWLVSWPGGQETVRRQVEFEGAPTPKESQRWPSSHGLFLLRDMDHPPTESGFHGRVVTYYLVVPEAYAGRRLELELPLPGGVELRRLTSPWSGPLWETPGGLHAVLEAARPGETSLAFEVEVTASGEYLWPAGLVYTLDASEPQARTGTERVRLDP